MLFLHSNPGKMVYGFCARCSAPMPKSGIPVCAGCSLQSGYMFSGIKLGHLHLDALQTTTKNIGLETIPSRGWETFIDLQNEVAQATKQISSTQHIRLIHSVERILAFAPDSYNPVERETLRLNMASLLIHLNAPTLAGRVSPIGVQNQLPYDIPSVHVTFDKKSELTTLDFGRDITPDETQLLTGDGFTEVKSSTSWVNPSIKSAEWLINLVLWNWPKHYGLYEAAADKESLTTGKLTETLAYLSSLGMVKSANATTKLVDFPLVSEKLLIQLNPQVTTPYTVKKSVLFDGNALVVFTILNNLSCQKKVTIEYESNAWFHVATPYHEKYVTELKKLPYADRFWVFDKKYWSVKSKHFAAAIDLVRKFYPKLPIEMLGFPSGSLTIE